MTTEVIFRQYVELNAHEKLRDNQTREWVEQYIADRLYPDGAPSVRPFTVLVSEGWHLELEGSPPIESEPFERFIVSLQLNDEAYDLIRKYALEKDFVMPTVGADLPLKSTEHWCPRYATDPIFGNRNDARQLMQVDYLSQNGAEGENVNVVVVDRGLDKSYIGSFGGAKYGGGWTRARLPKPGTTVGGHGMMIVRNILDIAPKATIFDCPLLAALPGHITNIESATSDAASAYGKMIDDIVTLRNSPTWQGPWIFVNAWAVYNRKSEKPPGHYSNRLEHILNAAVSRAVQNGIDVVFCAGNCGQFCPDPDCGPNDRGPGESILGANGHADVITVSAVRTDRIWLGYSSQGPGQPKLDPHGVKPDFCAPSQFCEMDDASAKNTGTSAACAITAGVVAALRSKWDSATLPLDRLKTILKETATKTEGGPELKDTATPTEVELAWRRRIGSGILNAQEAYKKIANPDA